MAQARHGALAHELLLLLAQVTAIGLGVVVFFSLVFGLMRVADPGMAPRLAEGDLVLFYRLDKSYATRDVAVFAYEGQLMCGRVVAQGGDTVDINTRGLLVNGAYQQEQGIVDETVRLAGGVELPLTVPDGSVFLLGDNRDEAVDSRVVGCVPADQTLGKVIGLVRRCGRAS